MCLSCSQGAKHERVAAPDDNPRGAANVPLRQVGRGLIRTDAPGKAEGRTRCAGDYTVPDMLHAKMLRCLLASARLKRMDMTKARAPSEVVCASRC